MKKLVILAALSLAIISCNSNSSTENNAGGDSSNQAEMSNPAAGDTTRVPDGVTNSSVISTDTAAMNVQNSINKAKEVKKHK